MLGIIKENFPLHLNYPDREYSNVKKSNSVCHFHIQVNDLLENSIKCAIL